MGDRSDYDPYLLRAIEAIARRVKETGITQAELAEKAGTDQGTVSRALSGDRPEVAFYVVVRMLLALDVSVDWAIGDAPPAPVRVSLLPSADAEPVSSSRPSTPVAK